MPYSIGSQRNDKRADDTRTIIYTGSSMNPLLRDLDRLYYRPYLDEPIRAGDVVVIDAGSRKIIHRVISIGSNGIITRGDNNYFVDSWNLKLEDIKGRVFLAARGQQMTPIRGGLRGLIHASPTIAWRIVLGRLLKLLAPGYRTLAGKCALSFIPLPLRTIAIQRSEGIEIQLLLGRRMMGRKRPGDIWRIKPPVRLFLKEQYLTETVNKLDIHDKKRQSEPGLQEI